MCNLRVMKFEGFVVAGGVYGSVLDSTLWQVAGVFPGWCSLGNKNM